MQVTITIPTPATILRQWRWTLLALLTLAFGLVGGGPAAAAGNSITSPDTEGDLGAFTSMALDASGNPVVSYLDYSNGDLKVLRCNDADCGGGGESITAPDTGGDVGYYTSLALDASGNPVISYYDHDYADLKVLHCNDPACAGGNDNSTAPDTAGDVGLYTSLALDASGNPVVSYYDNTNGALKVLHCNDANCAGGDDNRTAPDAAPFVGLYTSLALDASGNPVVSYWDLGSGDLRLLHCNDANCTGGDESITTPDTAAGYVGVHTSLALDASGNPVISYLDSTNGDLKLLHCNDANCAGDESANITAPDTAGLVGESNSLELDASGNPVVSYYDVDNSDLKVLHCGDATCTSGNVIARPDASGDVGQFSSLALDASGNPVVAYQDGFPNRDLKVLHCGTTTCAKPTSQIAITTLGQYALPKACYEVDNALDLTPLFTVCDNDFQDGLPESDPVCTPDGVCEDEDPDGGEIVVTVAVGTYTVVEVKWPPEHDAPFIAQSCDGSGGSCALEFINTPFTRPWHPWDLDADGLVRIEDVLAVIGHYFDDKPLP